jgi:hypothetical protein
MVFSVKILRGLALKVRPLNYVKTDEYIFLQMPITQNLLLRHDIIPTIFFSCGTHD